MSKLIVLGLILFVGLLPAGSERASGNRPHPTGASLELATQSLTPPGQVESAVSLPEAASTGWWATARENITGSEYRVTWQNGTYLHDLPEAYQAPNRAHNLRTYFTPTDVRVVPRTGNGTAWELGMRLKGYGYEHPIRPLAPATLSAEGNRIEYRRGGLTEWYVNDEKGLKQGFTIAGPPVRTLEGEGAEYLVLELALTGNLVPAFAEDRRAIDLNSQGGVLVLRYGSLYVEDAAGRQLPSDLNIRSSGISVLVDDSSAIYPIIVDPLLTSPSWTAESNQASAQLGYSVGTAGDVNGDGYSDVIVGAVGYDNGETNEGRAFVYHGSATGLSLTAGWTAESDQAINEFGGSVGTAGDVNGDGYSDVIVGARGYDNGESNEGRAFVYHGSATGLSLTAGWTAESDQAGADFGYSVGTVGTVGDVNTDGYSDVIIGAWVYDNGESNEGRTFVYHGSATGLSVTADWTAESNQAGAGFGLRVGAAGDVNGDGYSDVIVGAYRYDSGESDEGAAFVYHGSAAGLSATAGWTAESDQAGAWFGYSVGTAGDVPWLGGGGYCRPFGL